VANHGFSRHRERGLDEVKEQNLVIRVYDDAGNVIATHWHKGDFKEWRARLHLLPSFI
jgi:hypothetical protein